MLKLINLFVIDKIFSECVISNIGARAKMLYINCLMHHFRNKKATTIDSVSFSIRIVEVNNYYNFYPDFVELEKAELVVLENESIKFINLWGKYIDKSQLDKISIDEYVGMYEKRLPSVYLDNLKGNIKLYELIQMKHKVSIEKINALLELFVKEQEAFNKLYDNENDVAKHFSFWIQNNLNKVQSETVKTGAKILGLKR